MALFIERGKPGCGCIGKLELGHDFHTGVSRVISSSSTAVAAMMAVMVLAIEPMLNNVSGVTGSLPLP